MRRFVKPSTVEERLRRDAASARPEAAPDLVARVSARLADPPRRLARTGLRGARRVALALAAAGCVVALARIVTRARSSEPARELVTATAAPNVRALRTQLESLLLPSAPQLDRPLEAPLLDEAQRLASDGERLGRALLASLPSPLRPSLRPPSAE